MSLLDKARAHKPSRSSNRGSMELSELAIAWAFREVTSGQVSVALGAKAISSTMYSTLASALRDAVAAGLLVRKDGGS